MVVVCQGKHTIGGAPTTKLQYCFFISCSFTWFCIWVAVDLNLLTVIFLFFFFFLCCWKLLYALFLFLVILYLLIITECVNMFSWWKLILFILLNDDMTLISRCRVTRFLSIVLFFLNCGCLCQFNEVKFRPIFLFELFNWIWSFIKSIAAELLSAGCKPPQIKT